MQRKETHFNGNCMKFTRWFQLFFLFTPKLGEGEPHLTVAYFSNGLVQPPTRNCMKSSTLRLENLLVEVGGPRFWPAIATCAVPSSQVYEEPTRLLLVMEKLNGPDLFDAFSQKCLVFSECGEVTISTFLATDPKTTRFRKTTEMYDHFDRFPLLLCVVWVGS